MAISMAAANALSKQKKPTTSTPKPSVSPTTTSSSSPDLKTVTQTVREKGTAFNPMQDLQRSQYAAQNAGLPSGGYTPPTPSPAAGTPKVTVDKTTNADTLGNAPKPLTPAPETPVVGLDAGVQQYIDNYNAIQNATRSQELKDAESQRTLLQKRLEEAYNSSFGSAKYQDLQNKKYGVYDKQKQLEELNLQLASRKADYDKAIAAIPGQGRGLTTALVAGQTAREQRMASVELGALASVAQAVQGNLSLAQQTADRAVELEFQDRQMRVNQVKSMLDLNYDNLTRAEKKQADQLNYSLQQEQNRIDTEKENRKGVLDLTAQAAQNGAPNTVLTQMSKLKTPEEALKIGRAHV